MNRLITEFKQDNQADHWGLFLFDFFITILFLKSVGDIAIAFVCISSVQSRARHCAIDPLSEQLAQGRSPLGPNWRSANLTRYENMQRFSANFRSISVF